MNCGCTAVDVSAAVITLVLPEVIESATVSSLEAELAALGAWTPSAAISPSVAVAPAMAIRVPFVMSSA
jgi:hypothetical protein